MGARNTMLLLLLITLLAGCSGNSGQQLECVDVSAQCAPLYTPTFDEIYSRTLKPKCALSGGSCHSIDGAMAGLVFDNADDSYNLLLGNTDGRARVVPGDISCSILSERINAPRASQVMPPGSPLSAAERCVIIQWIDDGALR